MTAKKEIENIILSMSGQYAPYVIFSDWVEACALSIQNAITMVHDKVWQARETTYLNLVKKYQNNEDKKSIDAIERFAEMFVLLANALEEEMTDVLGEIYMECEMGNKYTGQFFTPFHLSELCARMAIDERQIKNHEKIHLHEPSCGGGGMIIAACKVLHEAGFNYQKNLEVVAQDLDWKGVYMTYLQLSLIGCKAIVVQGDTLREPYATNYSRDRIFRTPAHMGALL